MPNVSPIASKLSEEFEVTDGWTEDIFFLADHLYMRGKFKLYWFFKPPFARS